jgi:uncharacterized protein YybS (DUF2232 family)
MYFTILVIAVSLSSFMGCAIGKMMYRRKDKKEIF